jgi:hypothetical protein
MTVITSIASVITVICIIYANAIIGPFVIITISSLSPMKAIIIHENITSLDNWMLLHGMNSCHNMSLSMIKHSFHIKPRLFSHNKRDTDTAR